MIRIVRIQEVLGEAGYAGVGDNDPSRYVCKSPHTERPIIIPMGVSDALPIWAVQLLLRDEPDSGQLIDQMRD